MSANDGYPAGCTPENPCPAHGGETSGERFHREFLGGTSVEDFLIRELTDPDSPEFAGRSHGEKSQRARGIALMVMTLTGPVSREEAAALRAYLERAAGPEGSAS